MGFYDAQAACSSLHPDAVLVMPQTLELGALLYNWEKLPHSWNYWIGLDNDFANQEWKWLDEDYTPLSSTWANWDIGYPKDRDNQCAQVVTSGLWQHFTCDNKLARVVCQLDPSDPSLTHL